jgi:hypothetical protein
MSTTSTIRSQLSVLTQPKYDDGVPVVSQSEGTGQNTRFLNIVNENNIIDTTTISQFKNLIESKIGYNIANNMYQYAETADQLKKNLADAFPQGFILMSTDTSTGSYISYRLTNRFSYAYDLNTNILFLINQTISQLPFTLSCDVYTSSGTKTSVFTPVTSMPPATSHLYRDISATIPANGYIEIRIDNRKVTALPPSLSNYLFISNTGTKVPAPAMTYASTTISSKHMEMDATSITLNLKPSLANDSLNGHKVQFSALKSGATTAIPLGSPITIANGNSVTLNLTKGQLDVGVYAIKVAFNRPNSITNYLNNSTATTNQLSYTVTPQNIVLSTVLENTTLSYLRSLVVTSTTNYNAAGKVSLKIVDANANATVIHDQDSMTYNSTNKQYSFSKKVSGSDSLSLELGKTYTVTTKFTPNDTVNYLASDDVSLNATVDPYRMSLAVDNNLTSVKYRGSIKFTADTVTGNVHVDIDGTKSISIYKLDGEFIETQPSPYTLSPYTNPKYLVGNYKARAVFSDNSGVLDSSDYNFSIQAQDTILTVNAPESRTESDGRQTSAGIFEYSYNSPFTVSGTLKTDTVTQATASELAGITNFVLIRNSSVISSHISGVTLSDDSVNKVILYSFTVSSPEDIGVGLDQEQAVDFYVAWQPSGGKYLESRSPIKVKALKDFVTLTIKTNITGEQIMKFEDTLTIECRVANQQPSDSPSLNGRYTLKHKMESESEYKDVESKDVTDGSNTVSFTYSTTVIGVHMFFVDYNIAQALANNFYDEIRTPSQLTVTVIKVDTNFDVQLKDVAGNPITTASDVYKKLKYHVTNCLSQFGAGHPVAGMLSMSIEGLPKLEFDGNATEGYFVTHTLMQYLLPVSTTSFTFTFTPTDLGHFNVSVKTLQVSFKTPGALVFEQASFANITPSYFEKVVVNLQYTLIKNGTDQDIPLEGKLELLDNNNIIFSKANVTVNTNEAFLVNTDKNPYEFGYNANAPKTLTIKFTPTNNSYIYYTEYSKNVILTPTKQTLQVVNIITSSTTYTHGLQLGLKVNTNNTYPFSGTIIYNIKKVGSILEPIEVGRVTITNNHESEQIYYRTPESITAGDNTSNSTLYQISCVFISNDNNFNDGITNVVTKTITYEKSTLEMKNLTFSYRDGYTLLEKTITNVTTVYNDGINMVNKSALTISGNLYNEKDTVPTSNVVKDGTVYIVTRYFDDDRKIQEIEHASGAVTNNFFTITHIFEKSIEIFLKYKSDVNFQNQDLDVSVEGANYFETFYISLINTPYEITMSLNKENSTSTSADYHDGLFRVQVYMNFLRSAQSITYSGNTDKILLTICSEDETEVLYSTRLNLELLGNTDGTTTTTYSNFLFNPRKLSSTMATKTISQQATTTLTKGLEAGKYVIKAMYEGIAGFYDAEQAVNVIDTTQKYIKFTVEQTVPGINSYLTHLYRVNNEIKDVEMVRTLSGDPSIPITATETISLTNDTASFFYRELPVMGIRIQSSQESHKTTYDADNDLLGTTVVQFLDVSLLTTQNSYIIDNTSATVGAGSVVDNTITNITGGVNGFKIVTLPKINAGTVSYIALRFTPTDTRNYTIKNIGLRTDVKKYTPVLLNAPNTDDYKINVVPDKDGSRSDNVLLSLAYETNGVINYDENFEVYNKLQRNDPLTNISYDNINGELIFRYYSTMENVKTSIDDTELVAVTNNKLDYKTTFNPMKVLAERINIGLNQTMIVSFKPTDLNNYNESDTISRNFSIYIANSVGLVEIDDPVSPVVVFNKDQTLTLTATVTFGTDVSPQTGNLSFYWGNQTDTYPVFDGAHLLSISKETPSTGIITVGATGDYSLTIDMKHDSYMVTPRFAPYVIYAKLTPTSNNYPVIIQSVSRNVQINPSLVITISSTKGNTSVSGPNTLSSIQVGDAGDDIILTATLVHNNTAYTGGVANFYITHVDTNTTYVAGVPFTNNVATFRTKYFDAAQNILQGGVRVSQFTMGFGEYVVACRATFGDNQYKEIDQDYLNGYLITNRISTYSLSINKTNIVYGHIRPEVTIRFDEDAVYGGAFTYTIKYTSVNGVTTIPQVQTLTNNGDAYGANPPSKVYTLKLSELKDSSENIIDLTVGSYSITSSYSSPPNFSGTSSNTVFFVVNKEEVTINPLNNYYLSLATPSQPRQFTLSATLANPDITDESVKFINTTTNQVYSATHSGGEYSVTLSGNDLVAGTYEIMAHFSGNFNYNKSNNVFSNLIVQRQQKTITLSLVSPNVNASNEYTLNVNTVSGDTVHVYSKHKKEAIAVLSHTTDHPYKIADTLLNVGLNHVFVTVVHPNYSGTSDIVEITRPKMPLTVSSFVSSALSVRYKDTVTLTANVTVTGRGYTVTEGETMDFYVNGSHAGTVDVVSNVATLTNVCLHKIGANVIVAKFVNSKSYVCENTHSSITVNVAKADMAVKLYDETSSDMNKLNNKTVSLYLGGLTPDNKTSTTDAVVEFSRINSGTATFYNNNDIIYDKVPVINGVASISLSMDLASYSIKATFNGNDNYNESVFSDPLLEITTTQRLISVYYASVTIGEGSTNDGKTCYIVANVALKSDVVSMPSSSLLLNTGVVTFTYQNLKEIVNPVNGVVTYENETVTKIVNLVDGVATASFKSSSKNTLPTIVYSNSAYSGTLTASSVAWPVDYLSLDYLNDSSRTTLNIFTTTGTQFDINKPFRFIQPCVITILVRAGTYIRYIDTSVANPVVTKTTIKDVDEYVILTNNSVLFYVIFSQNTTSINISARSLYGYQGTWDYTSNAGLSVQNGIIQSRSFEYYSSGTLRNHLTLVTYISS